MKHILASLLVACATALPASAQTLSIEGGGSASTTGLLPQAFAPHAAAAGHDIQVVLNQTLTKSLMKVGAGQLDLAVTPPAAYRAMQRGVGPYKSSADQAKAFSEDVRALFAFQGSTMHPIVWADSGIESWEDLKGKRIFVGPPAGAAAGMTHGYIEVASGMKPDEDYEQVRLPWGQAAQGFRDGQYDMYMAYYPVGSQTITELGLQRPIRILPLPADVHSTEAWQAYGAKSGIQEANIAAGSYGDAVANGDADFVTGATSMMITANAAMDEQTAYDLTKAYMDALPEMKAANALLATQDADNVLFGITAKLHPGASRYYDEQGIAVPDALK